MTVYCIVSHPDSLRCYLDVREHIRAFIRKVQVVLQDTGTVASEDILFGQTLQPKQGIAAQNGCELLRCCQISCNLRALGQRRRGHT